MKIEAKQYDKEGTLFWSSKRKKKQARKNGPPQYDPEKISDASPQDLCLTERLGGMEANVMAGRALFCVFRPRTALRHVHPPREDNARQE